jgi:predicted Zn-dependent protease
VDWGVGQVSNPSALAETGLGTYGAWLTDQNGRDAYEMTTAYVVFANDLFWQDENSNAQGPVAYPRGDLNRYRIDIVTRHEAGHVLGFDAEVPSPYISLMSMYYPNNNGQVTSDDIETLRDLYDVRQFDY